MSFITQTPHHREAISHAIVESSLGTLLVANSGRGVCMIAFGDRAEDVLADLAARFPGADLDGSSEVAAVVAREVARVIDEPLLRFERPLDARGTPFQRLVWDELSRMGPGETVTYAGLAQRIGRIGAARAVAAACAANPLAVVIPCHRVVGSNGSLTGYRWGIDRKRTLLERERDAVTTTR